MIKKIIILTFLLLISFWKSYAFLWKDEWLNLYKTIDEWMYKLNNSQIEYELKWGYKVWDISKNLNKRFKANWLKECIKSWINQEKLDNIVNWNIKVLQDIIKPDCNKDWFSNSQIANYISIIKNFVGQAQARANKKSTEIYNISKIGLYTDWNTNNSPFDLIKDLQDIDKVIFWEKIEYNWVEKNDFLSNYENNPLKTSLKNNSNKNNDNNDNKNNNKDNSLNNQDKKNNIPEKINNETNNNISELPDWNNYACPQFNNQSWLSPDQLEKLKNDISNNSNPGISFKTTPNWHIKLPDTNQINVSWNNYNNTNNWVNPWLNWNYIWVNDNSVWKCSPDSFFCITIDFITHNQKLLWYWATKSIQSIIEMSNKHLKKWANTSLLQSKMWTNNFENILRDLDFSKMFHMWVVITKKSPPILNIENLPPKDTFVKDRLTELYKNQWLDYKRANDLNLVTKKEKNQVDIQNTAWLSPTSLNKKEQERKTIEQNMQEKNNFLNSTQLELLNKQSLNEFYQELLEYEKFIDWLSEYSSSIKAYINKMYKIPEWS